MRRAGAIPVLIPPTSSDPSQPADGSRRQDGVIITGGSFDIAPSHYGQAFRGVDRVDEARTGLELELAKRCIDMDKPLLGICGGMQAMAVAAGGSLIQDILTHNPQALDHEQFNDPCETSHIVELSSHRLESIYQSKSICVNSTHHKAVDGLGPFVVAGCAPDNTIEAIELTRLQFCVGVQWHPELLDDRLVDALVRASEDQQ